MSLKGSRANGRYAASGHLVFWRAGALLAAPFDLDTLDVGEPVTVVEGVRLWVENGSANFALSDTGVLAYVPGGADAFAESFVVDRSGRELVRLDATQAVGDPQFSPDGEKVAVTLLSGARWEVGVFDLERRVLDPIMFDGENMRPTWTPDGERLTYVSDAEGGRYSFYAISGDGSGSPERLIPLGQDLDFFPATWSPDGESLVYPEFPFWPLGSEPLYTNAASERPDFFIPGCSAPNSRQRRPRSRGNRLEPLLSGHSSDTAPHLCRFFAQAGFVALGRASACRRR